MRHAVIECVRACVSACVCACGLLTKLKCIDGIILRYSVGKQALGVGGVPRGALVHAAIHGRHAEHQLPAHLQQEPYRIRNRPSVVNLLVCGIVFPYFAQTGVCGAICKFMLARTSTAR